MHFTYFLLGLIAGLVLYLTFGKLFLPVLLPKKELSFEVERIEDKGRDTLISVLWADGTTVSYRGRNAVWYRSPNAERCPVWLEAKLLEVYTAWRWKREE